MNRAITRMILALVAAKAGGNAQFKVTEGSLGATSDGRVTIDEPKVRAVIPGARNPSAELHFTYLGPTAVTAALSSGELRRQIGLKLRAQDSCNLVYVMWRLDPKPGLVVSVKRNPGAATHAECGAGGYENIKPAHGAPLPAVAVGSSHSLEAELRGLELHVRADGAPVWDGTLPAEALAFDGPVGLRTDNGRFVLELKPR